jgi:hypothetical protein
VCARWSLTDPFGVGADESVDAITAPSRFRTSIGGRRRSQVAARTWSRFRRQSSSVLSKWRSAAGGITRVYVIANPLKLTRLDEPAQLAR